MEPLTLHDLILNNQWKDVQECFGECYTDIPPKDMIKYEDVYNQLTNLDVGSTPFRIMFDIDTDGSVDVYGFDTFQTDGENRYALDFVPWAEWVSMTVDEDVLMKYFEEEILSYCLMELSWHGWSNEAVQKRFDKVKNFDPDLTEKDV